MLYVKKLRESGESYEHLQVAEEEAHNYLENGWDASTLEEWEAQLSEDVPSSEIAPDVYSDEILAE